MIDFYLVTGFLGSGKTTFLKNFVRMFSQNNGLRVIINEYGKVGIDGVLLAETGAKLSEINNGSIFCSCRLDQFEAVLDELVNDPPETVIVEASGLSDPRAIRKIIDNERYASLDYKGSICIVDALCFFKVFSTARVCAAQLSVCDLVLINKTDAATVGQTQEVLDTIKARYPDAAIHKTSFGTFKPEWLSDLKRGRTISSVECERDITLQKYTVTINKGVTYHQLERFIRMFIEDTYRVKGFVCLTDGCYLVDCVGVYIKITPWEAEPPLDINVIVVLAGKGMNPRKSIKKASEWYPGLVINFT